MDVQECTFLQPERASTFMKRLQSIAKTNWRTDPSVQDVIIAQFFKCLPPNVVSMINLTDKLDDLNNIARLADCAIEQTVTCNSQTRPNDFDNFKNVITAQMQELCTQEAIYRCNTLRSHYKMYEHLMLGHCIVYHHLDNIILVHHRIMSVMHKHNLTILFLLLLEITNLCLNLSLDKILMNKVGAGIMLSILKMHDIVYLVVLSKGKPNLFI